MYYLFPVDKVDTRDMRDTFDIFHIFHKLDKLDKFDIFHIFHKFGMFDTFGTFGTFDNGVAAWIALFSKCTLCAGTSAVWKAAQVDKLMSSTRFLSFGAALYAVVWDSLEDLPEIKTEESHSRT